MDDRDWPEDFEHENGNYSNTCCMCQKTFTGHKRRNVCKVCSLPTTPADSLEALITKHDITLMRIVGNDYWSALIINDLSSNSDSARGATAMAAVKALLKEVASDD